MRISIAIAAGMLGLMTGCTNLPLTGPDGSPLDLSKAFNALADAAKTAQSQGQPNQAQGQNNRPAGANQGQNNRPADPGTVCGFNPQPEPPGRPAKTGDRQGQGPQGQGPQGQGPQGQGPQGQGPQGQGPQGQGPQTPPTAPPVPPTDGTTPPAQAPAQ